MFKRLFISFRGFITGILFLFSIFLWFLIIFLTGILAFITPICSWRRKLWRVMHTHANNWVSTNSLIMKLFIRNTTWDVRGEGVLNSKGQYLLIANHFSWLDIIVLGEVFNRRIPMLRFFMKRELLWKLPFGGIACWMLGYPFVYNYSKSYLAKHPEKKGKDLENAQKVCERFKYEPITMTNFVEGGRYNPEAAKSSPYTYLLKPKSGAAGFALTVMGENLHNIIDVTIVYPDRNRSFWDFLCGRMSKIIVRYDVLPITPELQGDYVKDRAYRVKLQRWLNERWRLKDELIKQLLAQK